MYRIGTDGMAEKLSSLSKASDYESISCGRPSPSGAATEAAEDLDELPDAVTLRQNYLNPFNPSTRIDFSLPFSSPVRLSVFDMLGREVAVLVDGTMTSGRHSMDFDAAHLSSGMYVYRLATPTHMLTATMMLAK